MSLTKNTSRIIGYALIQLPDLLLCIRNKIKKPIRVQAENENHELAPAKVIIVGAKTNERFGIQTSRIEKLEKEVKEMKQHQKVA